MEARGRWVRRGCDSNGIGNWAQDGEMGAAFHIATGRGGGWGGGKKFSSGRAREGREGEGGEAGGREGYYKPFLTETLWRKGNRTVVIWASLRGDGKTPPFDSMEATNMVTGGFIIEGESA